MWTKIIAPKVFTHVQAKGREKLQKKYPDINFTTSDKASKKPKFPTVYIKKLQPTPRGDTTEGHSVEGTVSGFQIEVTTNTNQSDADNVADAIEDIMVNDLEYRAVGEPFPDNTSDVYRNVSRYQKTIGSDDILKF